MISLQIWQVILLAALITYATRSGGYLILMRFKSLPPRVEAALEAVPAAVLSTIVVPPALSKGPLEMVILLIAAFLCLRLPPIVVMVIALVLLVAGRNLFL